jgi:hypothetical protein
MKLLNLFKIFFLSSILSSSISLADDVVQVSCKIFDKAGNQLYKWLDTEELCLFLPDGGVISQTQLGMKRFDNKNKILWSQSGFFHHRLFLSKDGTKIFTLSAKAHNFLGKKIRTDTAVAIDFKTGKILAEFDIFDHFYELATEEQFHFRRASYQNSFFNYDFETTHANSIYELPPNPLSKKNPAFSEGNLLINPGVVNIYFIVDKNLKSILWKKPYGKFIRSNHDVQLNSRGELVVYANDVITEREPYSSILFLDPLKEESYPKDLIREVTVNIDGKKFYQPYVGGVQELSSGEMLVSIFSDKMGFQLAFLDTKNKIKSSFAPNPSFHQSRGEAFQEGRVINLSSFFKNRGD